MALCSAGNYFFKILFNGGRKNEKNFDLIIC